MKRSVGRSDEKLKKVDDAQFHISTAHTHMEYKPVSNCMYIIRCKAQFDWKNIDFRYLYGGNVDPDALMVFFARATQKHQHSHCDVVRSLGIGTHNAHGICILFFVAGVRQTGACGKQNALRITRNMCRRPMPHQNWLSDGVFMLN